MPSSWEGNRRSQTLVVLHLRAQGLEEGDEHPAYALLWSTVDFTFTRSDEPIGGTRFLSLCRFA